jgi:hypothetical protein
VITNAQIAMARGMTPRDIEQYPLGNVTGRVLTDMDAEFAQMPETAPAKAPAVGTWCFQPVGLHLTWQQLVTANGRPLRSARRAHQLCDRGGQDARSMTDNHPGAGCGATVDRGFCHCL